MYNPFKHIKSIKENLFKINEEEINSNTKFVLWIYIILMFFIIGGFVNDQRDSIRTPLQKYPYMCMNVIKNIQFSFEDLNNFHNDFLIKKSVDTCQELSKKIISFSNLNEIISLKNTYNKSNEKESTYNNKLNELKRVYPQILNEKIAGVAQSSSILPSNHETVKYDYDTLLVSIENEKKIQFNSIKELQSHKVYQEIIHYANLNQKLIENQSSYTYWYAFYIFISASLFLGVIIAMSYGIRHYLLKRKHVVISQLFYYIYLISNTYLIYYALMFILDIMPKYFLKRIIELFTQYNLIFLIQYFLIICVILVFAFIIKKMQKRKKEVSLLDSKTIFFSLNGNKCYQCNSIIKGEYCFYCGAKTKKTCNKCDNKENHYLAKFCDKCGFKFG